MGGRLCRLCSAARADNCVGWLRPPGRDSCTAVCGCVCRSYHSHTKCISLVSRGTDFMHQPSTCKSVTNVRPCGATHGSTARQHVPAQHPRCHGVSFSHRIFRAGQRHGTVHVTCARLHAVVACRRATKPALFDQGQLLLAHTAVSRLCLKDAQLLYTDHMRTCACGFLHSTSNQ